MADRNVLKQSSKRQTRTEEAAALIPLGCAEGRRLRTDNVSTLAKVHDQVSSSFSEPLIVYSPQFNKYYLDRNPHDVAKLLHLQPPQPPTERLYSPLSHRSITRPPRPPRVGHRVPPRSADALHSISRIVESVRHQRSTLRLASVIDFHALKVSDVVMDACQMFAWQNCGSYARS